MEFESPHESMQSAIAEPAPKPQSIDELLYDALVARQKIVDTLREAMRAALDISSGAVLKALVEAIVVAEDEVKQVTEELGSVQLNRF